MRKFIKKGFLTFILLFATLFSGLAYSSTKTIQFHISPEMQIEFTEQTLKIINLKSDFIANFNFGYKATSGFFTDIGIGTELLEATDETYKKNIRLTYDLMLGFSFMKKAKKSNNVFSLIAFGPSAIKPIKSTTNNLLDLNIGASIYADIETLINENSFLSLGGKITYSFLEFYGNSQAKVNNSIDISIFVGIGRSWNR